ncbi:MAG TPA: PaaI family thioesterase [Ilumatobacteraceae bacterium]|nr:PaaI family thioesterase [Ilumatobacteraceae bacterium]HRB03271.1 PaaI family thioesterase [Ilumatobacteraceae bacterium]
MMFGGDQTERLAGDARAELATACRMIIDELASSTARSEAFAQARDLVQNAVAILAAADHGRVYEVGEGSLANFDDHIFIDHSPVVGPLNPLAPPIVMQFDGKTAIGEVTFGSAYEGPPGCVHGGYIAAAFDEILGLSQGMSGQPGMTARLMVNYRSPTPLLAPLRFVGGVDHIEGRKIFVKGELRTVADDRLCAEADALFISMKPEFFQRMVSDRVEP